MHTYSRFGFSKATMLTALAAMGISCAGAGDDLQRAQDLNADDPMSFSQEERAMAVLGALFEGQIADESGEFAQLFDAVVDGLAPQAHAQTAWNHCLDEPMPSFVNMWHTGESTSAGSMYDARSLYANSSYCNDSSGRSLNNTNNDKFRTLQLNNVVVTCDWGEQYNLTGTGAFRSPTELSHEIFGNFDLGVGNAASNYDCSMYVGGNADDNGELQAAPLAGVCNSADGSMWTDFNAVNAAGSCVVTSGQLADGAEPVAVCGADDSAFALDTVGFDGTGSYDPDGDALSYSWALNRPDGSAAAFLDPTLDAPDLMMDLAGSYSATLTVTEPGGKSASCTQAYTAASYEDFRVELWWDNADDFDIHLLEPAGHPGSNSPRTSGDCYYANCQAAWNQNLDWSVPGYSNDDPRLDLDDIWALGPENTNIQEPATGDYAGTYTYFIHDYPSTAKYWGTNTAHSRIYVNGVVVKEYSSLITGENADYYVAQISWPSGVVSDCNGLSGC